MSISAMQPHIAAQILGVLKAKNYRSVRKRWRQLAAEHHPDKNPGQEKQAESNFKKYHEAFQVLEQYQKSVGQWPIPRGYTAAPNQGFRPPPPTNPHPEPSVRNPTNNRRRWRQHPPPPPPPPRGESRDRSWRKEKQPAQDPFSFNAGYQYQSTLVHRDAFNQKLDRYLKQVFPDEAAAQERMQAAYGQQFQIGDVKDILSNHQYGNGPIKIEYTPTGRRVSWDQGAPPVPPPTQAPPQAPKQTSGPMYGGNPLQGRPEATPQPQYQVPVSTLSVHPLAYEQWFHASRGTGAATLLPSILTHPNGSSNIGHFMVSYVSGVPHVNGVPCNIVLNPNAPVR